IRSFARPAASKPSAGTGAEGGRVPDPVLVVVGLVLGAVFAWLVARAHFGARLASLDALVRELREQRTAREGEAAALRLRLEKEQREHAEGSARLRGETGNLVTALRSPQVRGRWGEITLHRVVELAGLTSHCDYVEQVTVEGEDGRLRPDMVVHLPGGRDIVVDAKVPLAAYLEAVGSTSDAERASALSRHAKQVREHMTALAAKA